MRYRTICEPAQTGPIRQEIKRVTSSGSVVRGRDKAGKGDGDSLTTGRAQQSQFAGGRIKVKSCSEKRLGARRHG
jgi:hypothetical protein